MTLPLNQVIVGDCTEIMRTWPEDSIDLVVTSPPYWGLRDYGLGEDQLGLEPHPQLFIDHLVEVCREIRRVLKPSGTFWLNLGDTYYGSGGKGGQYKKFMPDKGQPDHYRQSSKARSNWLQPKQKLMIPARVAIALQHDDWILRSDVIWHKLNHMPDPAKDRLTPAHEHVFLLAKQRRYYFDLEAIRVPHQLPHDPRKTRGESTVHDRKEFTDQYSSGWNAQDPLEGMRLGQNPGGKNPGDVWRIATTPFLGAHFATFPPKLIEPIVKAGSPRWVCSRCGKPRTRILEEVPSFKDKEIQKAELSETRYTSEEAHNPHSLAFRRQAYRKLGLEGPPPKKTVGWTDCGCGEPWVPGVVLDPFGGSGTVGQVSRRLGRRFIIIEIKPEYAEMARQRVQGRYKPAPEGVTPFKT